MVAGTWAQNRFGSRYMRSKIKEMLAKNPQSIKFVDADTQIVFDVGFNIPRRTNNSRNRTSRNRTIPTEVIGMIVAKLKSGEIGLNELERTKSRICSQNKCGVPRNAVIFERLSPR